jgi:hypothetical protein
VKVMLWVVRATDRLREHHVEGMHVEDAPNAAVHEAPFGNCHPSQVVDPLNRDHRVVVGYAA